ncbi:MAG: HepT-like ribonuclease domain-containing protein [Thermodesulfobacteriota bacterium]
MSRSDDGIRLRHLLDSAREAMNLVQTRSRPDLDTDRLLNLALVRLLEIIGEAATRVSREYRENHPEIQWGPIVGLRNRLIHGYDEVDFDIMWNVIKDDLPPLVKALENLLGKGSS